MSSNVASQNFRRSACGVIRSKALAAVVLAGIFAAPQAEAQTYTWTGGSGVNSDWSNIFNWSGLVTPTSSFTSNLVFSGTNRQVNTNTLASNWKLGSLAMTNDGWRLSGFSLWFQAAAGNRIESLGADNRIANAVRLDANGGLNDNTISVIGAGSNLTMSGGLSGSGRIVKAGLGTLFLQGTNTTANMRIDGGRLQTSAQGLSGSTEVKTGATLTLLNGIDGTVAGNTWGGGTIQKTGFGTVTFNGAGTFSGTHKITEGAIKGKVGSINGNVLFDGAGIGRTVWFDQATDATFNGKINGVAGNIVRKTGAGRLWLFGAMDNALTLQLDEGTVALKREVLFQKNNLAAGTTLEVWGATGNQYQYAGQFIGDGTVQLRNAGTMELLANQGLHSGLFDIAEGTLLADNSLLGHKYQIGANATLISRNSGNELFQGTLSGSGQFRKSGTGSLDFKKQQPNWSGDFTLDQGYATITPYSVKGNLMTSAGTTATIHANGAGYDVFQGTLNGSGTIRIDASTGIEATNSLNFHTGKLFLDNGVFYTTLNGLSQDITLAPGAVLSLTGWGGTYEEALHGTGQLWSTAQNLKFAKQNALANLESVGVGGGSLSITTKQWNKDVTIATGGELVVDQSFSDTWKGNLLWDGTFSKKGSGTLKMQDYDWAGKTRSMGGTLMFDGVRFNSERGYEIGQYGKFRLNNDAELSGGNLDVSGQLSGNGYIASNLDVKTSGRVLVGNDEHLTIGGTSYNAGAITLNGGTFEADHALWNPGTINGHGTLNTGTLENSGSLVLTGDSEILGDVNVTGTGKVIISGESTATFHDDVTHNGTEWRTNAGSRSIFLGTVNGAGAYTGTGTVEMLGDLRPGNSPALSTFEGDLVLGSGTTTLIELGGTTVGSEYDAIQVGGTGYLAGTLDIVLYNGYKPTMGDSFQILRGTMSGTFDSVNLPELSGGMYWNTSKLYSDGMVEAVPEPASMAALAVGAVAMLRRRRK